jgi:nitroreductase
MVEAAAGAAVLAAIYGRRSVREFTPEAVLEEQVREVLRAASWAPSGLNNQPWRFVVVRNAAVKAQVAAQTRYGRIIEAAPVIIAVFIDSEAMYNAVKDHQAMGACLQNMLLAAHAMGLGAVWLGEILKSAAAVRDILGLPTRYELMAVVALGHPARRDQTSSRRELDELILKTL